MLMAFLAILMLACFRSPVAMWSAPGLDGNSPFGRVKGVWEDDEHHNVVASTMHQERTFQDHNCQKLGQVRLDVEYQS